MEAPGADAAPDGAQVLAEGHPGVREGLRGTIVRMSGDSRRHPGGSSFSQRANGAVEGGVEGRDAWCPMLVGMRGSWGSRQTR